MVQICKPRVRKRPTEIMFFFKLLNKLIMQMKLVISKIILGTFDRNRWQHYIET